MDADRRRQRDQRRPVRARCRATPVDLVAEHGDDTPIDWVHRDDRFGEKLATPDTSIADLIGEVDPIKVAEGRYLSDELTLHYGLVPRTNRGIFAINELPDLAERIQVGLLNVLEERDVQVRGYKIRLPARRAARRLGQPRGLHQPRPDHHAAEGPLRQPDPHPLPARRRDRDGDHAPGGAADVGRRRRRARARLPGEVIATVSHLARASTHVNQRSGVSVRLSVTNHEVLAANAAAPRAAGRRARRRAAGRRPRRAGRQLGRQDRDRVARRGPRGRDLREPRQGRRAHRVQGAGRARSRRATSIAAFEEGAVAHTGEDVPSAELAALVEQVPALRAPVAALTGGDESPAAVAAAVEFVLEGLHLSKRLNKDERGRRATYRGRS